MAEELVKAGFMISFGEAIAGEHSKVVEALQKVPVEKLFLETDEGHLDIREIYHLAAEIKGLSVDELRLQIHENANMTTQFFCCFSGVFNGPFVKFI